MENRESSLSTAERLMLEPEFAVLRYLESTRGNNQIAEVSSSIVQNGGIIVLAGEAGGGKTTVGSQLNSFIGAEAKEVNEDLQINSLKFDETYSKMERKTGLNRYEWNENQWKELNYGIAEETFKLHPEDIVNGKKLFTLIEVPLAGKTIEDSLNPPDKPNFIDRGVTSTILTVQEAKKRGVNIFVVYLSPDPALQMSSGYLRVKIPEIPPSDLLDYLAQHHILFTNFNPELYSSSELYEIQKKLGATYKKMAQPQHMRMAREYERAAESMYRIVKPEDYRERSRRVKPNIKFRRDSIIQVGNEFGIHDNMAIQSLLRGHSNVLDMLTYDDYKISSLDLPEGHGVVMQNPYRPNIPIYANIEDFINIKTKSD